MIGHHEQPLATHEGQGAVRLKRSIGGDIMSVLADHKGKASVDKHYFSEGHPQSGPQGCVEQLEVGADAQGAAASEEVTLQDLMKFFPGEIEELKRRLRALSRAPLQSPDADRPLDPSPKARERRKHASGFKEGIAKLDNGQYQITFRYADESGKLKRVRRTICVKSLAEAYRAKDALREEMRAKVRAQKDAAGRVLPLTVKDAVERFLIDYPVRRRLKGSTVANMRTVLRNHLVPKIGDRALSSLTIEDMHWLVASWSQDINLQRNKLYESSTHGNWVRDASSFFNSDPRTAHLSSALQPPTGSKRHRGRSLDTWEVATLLRALGEDGPRGGEHQHYYALFLMALITGQRAGSILALRWEDIDFDRRIITFAKSHYRGEVNEGNKTGRYAKLEVPRVAAEIDLFDALEAHRMLIREPRFQRHGGGRGELVFPPRQRDGERTCPYMSPESMTKLLKRLAKSLKLEKITFHDLRRTFVTRAHEAGVTLEKVSSMVGHAHVHTTAGYYAPTPHDHAEAIAQTQRSIFGESSPPTGRALPWSRYEVSSDEGR
jgi:integrase